MLVPVFASLGAATAFGNAKTLWEVVLTFVATSFVFQLPVYFYGWVVSGRVRTAFERAPPRPTSPLHPGFRTGKLLVSGYCWLIFFVDTAFCIWHAHIRQLPSVLSASTRALMCVCASCAPASPLP